MRDGEKIKFVIWLAAVVLCCHFLISGKPKTETVKAITFYYETSLSAFEKSIAVFEKEAEGASVQHLKKLFLESRFAYKKIEWLVEYHFPSTAQALNGPVLPEAEPSEPAEAQHPSGFQVLEELVYDDAADSLRKEILFELSTIANRIQRLQSLKTELELTESNILDALKLNLYRIITKAITGFDSPVSLNSINESKLSLDGMKEVVSFFKESKLILANINAALVYINNNKPGFDDFNRAVFIARYINPLSASLTNYQLTQQIPFGSQARAIAIKAKTLFDSNALQVLFYAPSGTTLPTTQQMRLGQLLFNEPLLSSTGKRSCASCHHPGKAFADGMALNKNLAAETTLLRNTPTLINAALQPAQFYDSRIAFLEDQVHDVISSKQEMGGMFDDIIKQLNKGKGYKQKFAEAFADKKLSAENLRAALAAYIRSLIAMNSAFDRFMRGEERAMNAEQVAGFNLFTGKAKCGTCHFMPTFSGSVPPFYDKMESEVLGIPSTKDTINAVMDFDSGKYHLYKIPHHLYSFKTPSLRNISLTAPYMHNGVFTTLEEVIDFYDRGGGAGLRFNLPNQTLPPDKLNLSQNEKKQLIAFLQALTDTVTTVRGLH